MKIIIDLKHPEIVNLMLEAKIVKSKTEWTRLMNDKAIDVLEIVLKIGKKRFIRIK